VVLGGIVLGEGALELLQLESANTQPRIIQGFCVTILSSSLTPKAQPTRQNLPHILEAALLEKLTKHAKSASGQKNEIVL